MTRQLPRPSQCLSYASTTAVPTTPSTTGSNNAARIVQVVPSRIMVPYHGSYSSAMIASTTPGAGLYFASSPRSLANSVSSTEFGRYSSTSCAHCAAFASNPAASSSSLALFADSPRRGVGGIGRHLEPACLSGCEHPQKLLGVLLCPGEDGQEVF